MNYLRLLGLVTLLILGSIQSYGQNQRVIRDVVLLNVEPYEVLMTEEGDILSKIRHLPNYLKSAQKVEKKVIKSEIASKVEEESKTLAKAEAKSEKTNQFKEKRITRAQSVDFKDHYEIKFNDRTATLTNVALKTLDELSTFLKTNPDQKVQVFGFENESPQLAALLSKRRRDACIAYLKIKGVRVEDQIIRGSITKGTYNKIVFGLQ